MNITVAIVEDQDETRQLFHSLINGADGFLNIAAYSNAEAAIAEVPQISPDVMMVDINLPAQSGIECVRQLKLQCPKTQFLMCTSLEDATNIFAALKAGASGYLTKATAPEKILEAIRDVYNGGSPMSSQIARKVISSFQVHEQEIARNMELEKLSEREQQILEQLSKGFRYKEIGAMLEISVETVRKHIHNIYEKLQVNSRTDALNKVYYS